MHTHTHYHTQTHTAQSNKDQWCAILCVLKGNSVSIVGSVLFIQLLSVIKQNMLQPREFTALHVLSLMMKMADLKALARP